MDEVVNEVEEMVLDGRSSGGVPPRKEYPGIERTEEPNLHTFHIYEMALLPVALTQTLTGELLSSWPSTGEDDDFIVDSLESLQLFDEVGLTLLGLGLGDVRPQGRLAPYRVRPIYV